MLNPRTGLLPMLPLALLAFGCSGGGGDRPPRAVPPKPDAPRPAASGKVTLNLVNNSAAKELRAVTLKLAGVDIREKGKDWVALPLTAPEVELLNSMGEAARPLVEAATVPAGVYTAFRIRFAPDHNNLRLRAGDQVRDLKVPSAIVDEDVHLNVVDGATAQVAYFFNTAYAVQEQPAGSGAYTLRAPRDGHFRDRAQTGAITGKVTWGADGTPMAGVAVSAQRWVKARPDLLNTHAVTTLKSRRTVVSREDGTFELDLLEAGVDYQVVAQPGGGPHPHKAQKLAGTVRPGPAPCQLALEPAHANPGKIAVVGFPGEIADQPETARRRVDLLTCLKDSAGKKIGVVQVAERSLDQGERCVFEGLEPGIYEVRFSFRSGSKGPLDLGTLNRPGGFHDTGHSSSRSFTVAVQPGETVAVPKAKAPGMSTVPAETEAADAGE